MFTPVQAINTFNGEQVGAYAGDAGSHAVEHLAQLLHIGFAGRIVDGGFAFCRALQP